MIEQQKNNIEKAIRNRYGYFLDGIDFPLSKSYERYDSQTLITCIAGEIINEVDHSIHVEKNRIYFSIDSEFGEELSKKLKHIIFGDDEPDISATVKEFKDFKLGLSLGIILGIIISGLFTLR